jgi:hypothetical protein
MGVSGVGSVAVPAAPPVVGAVGILAEEREREGAFRVYRSISKQVLRG